MNGNSSRPPKSHVPRGRRWLQFFGTAAITGVIFHLALVGLGSTEAVRQRVPTAVNDWLPGGNKSGGEKVTVIYEKPDCPAPPVTHNTTGSISKTPEQLIAEEEAPWTIEQIREMVSHTKGYYGRDYSLGLGWNNVRVRFMLVLRKAEPHIRFDTSSKHHCYTRAYSTEPLFFLRSFMPELVNGKCEYRTCLYMLRWFSQSTSSHACAAFAPMVNRGDAIGWGEWRGLPIEKQMGWRVPVGVCISRSRLDLI